MIAAIKGAGLSATPLRSQKARCDQSRRCGGGGGGGARGIFKSLLTFLSALEFISLVDSEDVLVRKSHMLLIAGFPGFNCCSTAQRGNVSLKRPYLKQFRWGCPQLKLVISGVAIKLFAQKRENILELT